LKKIVQNGLFLQSGRESVGSFLVVTFYQPTTVEKEIISFVLLLSQPTHLRL